MEPEHGPQFNTRAGQPSCAWSTERNDSGEVAKHQRRALPAFETIDRLGVTGLILFGWALIVVLRLVDLQVFAHGKYVKAAEVQQDKTAPVEPVRGSIVDRDGNVLAISSPSRIVAVNPSQIQNIGFAAALLGRVLQLDTTKLQADLEAAAHSKRHHGYFIVDPQISDEQADQLSAMKLNWLIVGNGSVRSYPNGQLAAHVLGDVNSEQQGAAGVELKLNKDLAGSKGLMRLKVDVKNRAYDSEVIDAPVMGKTIGLTIDSQIQHVAENALKDAVEKNHADHGSIVAMDPQTGEVLALANYPTYDPNERLHAGEKPKGREDLAVVAPFEPGSVFKVVTVSTALETTNLTPDSPINCGGGVLVMYSRVIHDSHPHGILSMADVLAKSSNIGAIRIGMQIGNKNLYEYIRRFGFGHRTGIELPAEAPGMLRPLKRWQPTTIGSIPMGHEISVTSLQLAQLGSVIANGGFLVHPHLVAWKQSPEGEREIMKYPVPVQVLKPETVMTMRSIMHRVVMPGGTAPQLHVTGYVLAGKTGTAQIYDFAHHVYTHKYNASFLGFAPLENPRLVVIVTVSGTTGQAGFGGSASGPAFMDVMSVGLRRLNVMRDAPEEVEELAQKQKDKEQKDKKALNDDAKESDDVSLAELNPPTAEDLKEALGQPAVDGAAPDGDVDPNAPKVPNFLGRTIKDVMQLAAADGIDVDMLGDGLARAQNPPAGTLLVPGEHIRVRFTR